MKYLWESVSKLPAKTIALVALIAGCVGVYHVYAGDVRTNSEAVIQQIETNRHLGKLSEKMDRRIRWLEEWQMRGHVPPPAFPEPEPRPEPTP